MRADKEFLNKSYQIYNILDFCDDHIYFFFVFRSCFHPGVLDMLSTEPGGAQTHSRAHRRGKGYLLN